MNLSIQLSERGVRDGVVLIAAYHFLLSIASFLGCLAVFVYAIIPNLPSSSQGGVQTLFLPILGVLISFVLSAAYFITGIGLIQIKNVARMTGIFLALFGIVVGIFSVMGGIIGSFSNMSSDWLTILMIGLVLICTYSILVFLDVITLLFLLNWQVRSVFYGEEWLSQASQSLEA